MSRGVPGCLLLPLGLLGLWHVAVQAQWVAPGIIPSPALVAESWYRWIFGAPGPGLVLSPYSGTWLDNVLYSSRRVLQGFLLAAAIHNLVVSGPAYPRPSRRQLRQRLDAIAARLHC